MKYFIIVPVAVISLMFLMVMQVRAGDGEQLQAELDELGLYLGADQLVEVATRSPKPLTQVAENVTIITAEEIEAMNAHTVAEVLNRVPGIIMDGSYTDFGSPSSAFIQGSDYDHVLVLVDGIRWGYVTYDFPETNTIPVQIIERIEIIKGAASSTWGSSLGGVVNIITKDTGSDSRPTGTLSGSYGEYSTKDLRGDAAGKIGKLGYYLYAGYQDSDGIRDNRYFENKSLYGKFTLDLPKDMEFGVTISHSEPEYIYYYDPIEWGEEGVINDEAQFITGFFSAPLTESLTLNLSAYHFEDTLTDIWAQEIATGNPLVILEYEGKSTGASGRLVWDGTKQTIVLGIDYEHRKNTDNMLQDVYSYWGLSEVPYTADTNTEDIWGFFINDTIRFGRLTFVPGLRYDHLSITDDQVSPSLGLTFQANDKTLFRANVSRGFRKPNVSMLEGDPSFHYYANPDLESETIWSYQAGIETIAIPFLRLKASLFNHEVEDDWGEVDWVMVNGDDFQRQGAELEIETASFHNFSLAANGAAIRMKPENGDNGTHYLANILLQYDDRKWRGQLFGHNVWLADVPPPTTVDEETGTFIWDLVLGRRFTLGQATASELFAALHNITDDDQYFNFRIKNAGRWFEAGIRLHY